MRQKLTKKQTAYYDGKRAEWWAKTVLRLKGYNILGMRQKTPFGEIDIVAEKSSTLICIEVKYRHSLSTGIEAVTPFQRRRIERSALWWLGQYRSDIPPIRFDIFIVTHGFKWHHMRSGWLEGD